MTPDLKQLQELLAAATPGPWRSMAEDKYTVAVIGQSNNEDRWVAENVREPNAQFIIAAHKLIPALLASHEALSAEKWEQGSLLASTTDLLNTWARESNVTEAQNEKGIRDLADRLWSKLSGELCAQRRQIEALSAEVAGLRTTLREIGNRAGAPTMTYCEPIENREQRESLDWIAEKVRAAIDAARGQEKKDE